MTLMKNRSFSFKKIDARLAAGAFVLMLVILLNSCSNQMIFRENNHISSSGWSVADSIAFSFKIDDTLAPVNIYFNVRNSTDYPYQNLYFFITTLYPGGEYSRDTAECILAGIDGKWLGKGKGKTRDSKFLFRKEVRFRKAGNYTIFVNQAMREDILKGISDVGLIIQKPDNE